MAEYIEREAAKKLAERYGCTNGSALGIHSGLADCIASEIEALPAADVEKVRHCRWVLVKNGTKRDIYRCPWCGRLIDTIIAESELARLFPYCHCGTKMDRGED